MAEKSVDSNLSKKILWGIGSFIGWSLAIFIAYLLLTAISSIFVDSVPQAPMMISAGVLALIATYFMFKKKYSENKGMVIGVIIADIIFLIMTFMGMSQ